MKRKFLSLIIILTMLLSFMPVVATAAIGGTCGNNLTWTLYLTDGTLTISGTGDMNNYTSSSMPWYNYRSSIQNVTIEDGITSIGNCAFYGCKNIPRIILPYSVTSIGNYAFYGCSNLTSINIPYDVTYIGYSAFQRCSNLVENIIIPEGVTYISSYTFAGCTSLTSITLSNNITSIGQYAFQYCSNLSLLIIPDKVTSIGAYAFDGCKAFTYIDLPDNVTSIGYSAFSNTAYYNDTKNWDNNVLYINNHLIEATPSISKTYTIKDGTKCVAECAFSLCENLESIVIPGSVVSTGYSFKDCTKLTSVTILDGVTSIDNFAFYGCSNLTSLTIPKSVTRIGTKAFYNCDALSTVTYAGSKSDWDNISVSSDNECFTTASITYKSIAPTPTPIPTPTQKPPTYTVTYNSNGGSGTPANQTKTHGTNLTLSSSVPIRTGYAFIGWATSATATTAKYQPGDTYSTNANLNLYAIWEIVYDGEINELSLQTQSGEVINAPMQNESFIVRVKYSQTEARSNEDYLFVAVYGTDGQMLSIDYIQMDFIKGSSVSVGFNVPAQSKQIGSIKAYVWNSFSSQKPLAKTRTLTF